jgi:hypothetical protein
MAGPDQPLARDRVVHVVQGDPVVAVDLLLLIVRRIGQRHRPAPS